jgi:ribosomal protein S18 acetylase RimI-like enzyme
MLSNDIKTLIREEQARQSNRFVEGVELEAYLRRLDERAEVVSEVVDGRCRGFVAYYCNNLATRQAYITLVLVAPDARGTGLGRALVTEALAACRGRGFVTCRLEVRDDNAVALAMYRSMGFTSINELDGKHLMEFVL